MELDAKHGPLVIESGFCLSHAELSTVDLVVMTTTTLQEAETMGRGLLLWMLGIPIPVIILLWLFFGR